MIIFPISLGWMVINPKSYQLWDELNAAPYIVNPKRDTNNIIIKNKDIFLKNFVGKYIAIKKATNPILENIPCLIR